MNHLSDSQLNEYLDDALHPATRQEVEAHLKICENCQARLEELELVFSSLETLEETILSHDLAPRILAGLPHKMDRTWTPAFAAQLGAVLGALLWLSWQISRTLVVPGFPTFQIPQLTLPEIVFRLPAFNPLQLLFGFQWAIPHFALSLPKFPRLPFSASRTEIALIGIAALLIWLGSNVALLYNQMEHKR